MPIMDGVEATRIIAKNYPTTKVLMLSMFTKPPYIEEALDAGAKGYMCKESSPKEVEIAIKEIVKGNLYLSPSISQAYIAYTKEIKQCGVVKISTVEKNMLQLLSTGLTTKQVAKKLEIGEYTISNYRKNLMIKFGVNNITGLLAAVRKAGYIK